MQASAAQQWRAPLARSRDGRAAWRSPDPQRRIRPRTICSTTPTRRRSPPSTRSSARRPTPALRRARTGAGSDHGGDPGRGQARRGALHRGARAARRQGGGERIQSLAAGRNDPEIAKAAATATATIERSLLLWGLAQNGWYGLSAASVLLLAAIGLAITFGVMGVINMAHGEMVMLGAYSTYIVQASCRPRSPTGRSRWRCRWPSSSRPRPASSSSVSSCAISTRPLDTLLATWGVSLVLQQTVRTCSARATGRSIRRRSSPARFISAGWRSPTTGSGSSCWPASCSPHC